MEKLPTIYFPLDRGAKVICPTANLHLCKALSQHRSVGRRQYISYGDGGTDTGQYTLRFYLSRTVIIEHTLVIISCCEDSSWNLPYQHYHQLETLTKKLSRCDTRQPGKDIS